MASKFTITHRPEIFKTMRKNAPHAKEQFLKRLAKEAEQELFKRTPKDTGRSARAIIHIIEDSGFFVGWTDEEFITHLATLNYGSTNNPNGWIISAKNAQTLIFPEKEGYGPYNLPQIDIGGKKFYIAKKVHHPYQKGLKFIEGTLEEIRSLIHRLAKQSYFQSLKGGGRK
ncbi:HK97 gp10 family phage protein [Paenibacillus contaminans]|uniref:Uncharacterized protein n=1 Tax=Paenibacillus contaminans TaxID=450362 RepID=A0A329MTG2_9BACL|nr:HK97 gp10 family phage protein [Paenibacillus contaminans]RAV22676.1 hypothetical protein DQG23_00195 [Paenibacillus contaminans]